MIEISPRDDKQEDSERLVSTADILEIIENNRTRIRTLSGIVLTVCGLLLSTSFIVLFFILTDTRFSITPIVPILLFSTSGSLSISIVYSVLAAHLPTPTTIHTKLELIDRLTTINYREYRRVAISVVFLLLGIALFALALGIFGISLL